MENNKQMLMQTALSRLLRLVQMYENGEICITTGMLDYDEESNTYDVAYLMGYIHYLVAEGLGQRQTHVPDKTELPNPYEDAE